MSNLNRSVQACVYEWLVAAELVSIYAAVPLDILRDATGHVSTIYGSWDMVLIVFTIT